MERNKQRREEYLILPGSSSVSHTCSAFVAKIPILTRSAGDIPTAIESWRLAFEKDPLHRYMRDVWLLGFSDRAKVTEACS